MNFGKYIFSQIADFLPKRYFERLVMKSIDKSKNWELSAWNQLLVLMYGQLASCLRLILYVTIISTRSMLTIW